MEIPAQPEEETPADQMLYSTAPISAVAPSNIPVPIREKTIYQAAKNNPAFSGRRTMMASDDEADYEMVNPRQMFSDTSNLIPGALNMKGSRLFISAKYFGQSLPTKEQEAPLVDALDYQTNESASRTMGRNIGLRPSQHSGTVVNIGKGYIEIKDATGTRHKQEIYDHFPNAKKTFVHDRPLVKIGDMVKEGQTIARSNFVTDEGDLAMGRNLRVAFAAAPGGSSFEDSIAVSQTAAKKMTSTHLAKFLVDTSRGDMIDKKKFISIFPGRFTTEQLDKLDDNGVAKPGVKLSTGDPVMLAFRPRVLSSKDSAMGNHSKMFKGTFEDQASVWEKPYDGVVTDSVKSRTGFRANVSYDAPLKIGDKLSARQGAKGVVGAVHEDKDMPLDENGDPIEIFINPAALIGRVNPAMVFEAQLGKIAARTGKRIVMEDGVGGGSTLAYVRKQLEENGINANETLTNQETGRQIKNVMTGVQYFMKLEHTADGKISGRDDGATDINEQPSKGGSEGAKRLGGLINTALLGYGATEVLRDAHVYRGVEDPDTWKAIRSGNPLPHPPKVPFIYNKYLNTLRGAGIRVTETNRSVGIAAMTDKDVDALSPIEVESAETIDDKTGAPIPGGLFDYAKFGGPTQRGWGVVTLDEPIPNPIMEDSVRAILGVTGNEMRDIMSGKKPFRGISGPKALPMALRGVNLDTEEADARQKIESGRSSVRNDALKKLRAIRGLRNAKLNPEDLLVSKIPVIPPAYRPAVKMGDMTIVSDSNYLYKDLLGAKSAFRANREILPDEDLVDERLAIYDAVRAVQGLGDPIHQETRDKGVKGFLQTLTGAGKGPKTGLFMSKVLGHPVNTVGRSVIVPDSRLNMDQVGLPEKMAWNMYEPFVMGRMVRDGMSSVGAAKLLEARAPEAKKYLLEEMKYRGVMYSRDPALHRFSILGAEPVLVPGDALRISPLVVKPLNADFDGDQMNVHVPVSKEAIAEIREKMLPSKNLFSISKKKPHFVPSQEFVLGIYNATKPNPKMGDTVRFRTQSDAIEAYKRGEISIDAAIQIG